MLGDKAAEGEGPIGRQGRWEYWGAEGEGEAKVIGAKVIGSRHTGGQEQKKRSG